MTEKQKKAVLIDAIQDKKGSGICIINLKHIESSPTQEFIICQGKTPTQTSAIADNVIDRLRKETGQKPASIEGMRNGQWIILDYGDKMIHIFTPETREFYNLEDLWSDGKFEVVPDLD